MTPTPPIRSFEFNARPNDALARIAENAWERFGLTYYGVAAHRETNPAGAVFGSAFFRLWAKSHSLPGKDLLYANLRAESKIRVFQLCRKWNLQRDDQDGWIFEAHLAFMQYRRLVVSLTSFKMRNRT